MSEQQKFFASVSGALIAHVLLFVVVFLLLSTGSVGSASLNPSRPEEGPKEVVIDISELMERFKVEPPMQEPEPAPVLSRPFMSTDTNRPEAEAPENAMFESDRHTTAASELAPDPNRPLRDGPTLAGDDRFDIVELETREYTDGEISQPALMASALSQATQARISEVTPANAGFSAEIEGEDLPNPESRGGEDAENSEGAGEEPVEEIADRTRRPDGAIEASDNVEETMQNTFVDPNGDPNASVRKMFEEDENQFAAESEKEAEIGTKADPDQEKTMASGKVGNEGEVESNSESKASKEQIQEMAEAADDGIFVEGYNRERLQSRSNGTVSNIGDNAVDAEETPVGKYKKQVHDAIGKMWYRYLGRNKGNVTWGVLKLEMRVDTHGKVHDLRVVKNEANTLMVEFSLQAVIDANIPPMPTEVEEILGIGGLDLDYDFIIY